MKPLLLAVALIFVASAKLQATEALIFDGGGHNLYILVGSGDRGPVVAEVRYTPPGANDWMPVPRELLQIEKFDMKERILIMRFPKQNDPELAPPFSFSVKKNRGVLSIKGKKFRGPFDWLDE
jgi:hypothetical protein